MCDSWDGWYRTIVIGLLVVIVISAIVTFTPAGRAAWNNLDYQVQKVDEVTNYETLKNVEDTCRSMIASYESDLLTYEQYKNSDNPEQRGWAEQARMRANKTASSYNNYILKNSYVWENNVPSDIYMNLPHIE